MVDLKIINGKIFLETGLLEADLAVDKGKIVAIGKTNKFPSTDKIIDATGKIIIPGGIDVHTHILDLKYAYRETFTTGTQAAASGGITTVLEMPLGIEGKTVIEVFDMQLEAMKEKCLVDFGIIGSAGYRNINSISELAKKGAIGFKTFMINPSEEEAELKELAAKNDYFLLKIFTEIAKTRKVSSIHAENDAIITHEIEKLKSSGQTDFKAHTRSRPSIGEDEACIRAILFAHYSKVKLNLVHVSSKSAFELIRQAKKNKRDVTCEITPHHLFLNSDDGQKIGAWAKVDPPLRSKEHVVAAWKALNDGTIDMIASDHSPYSLDEKTINDDNFFECGSGTTGVETILPLMIDAVNKKRTSLQRIIKTISSSPAKRFGIYPRKGTIRVNADADLVIIDMHKEYTLKNEKLFTKPKITIFNGMNLKGAIEKTLVRGKIIFDSGMIHATTAHGEFITPDNY
ncbi:MAG: dihydroorotase [Candidatus Hodarchaeales archaeon]|jgi:dihydropyrimidinase/allantoinase